MKKIVCELCESTVFTKESGYFICQGCGTKYSLEEAKGMMREVEGDTASAPIVGVPAGNPNQAQIDNILLLASNAYSASNNEETEKYCNRAIELDATCYKAWMLKGKAAGWQSTIQNPRIAEAAHSFKQAVDFAPDEEKASLTEEGTEELKRLGLACIALRQKRFSQYPDAEELKGFVSDLNPLIDGLVVLLSKDAEVAKAGLLSGLLSGINVPSIQFIGIQQKAKAAGLPSEFFAQIAVMMGNAAMDGYKTTTNKYNSNTRPGPNDFKKAMNEVDNCIALLDMANTACDEDDADDIKRLNNKIMMEEYLINMTAYPDYSSYSRTWQLTDEAKKSRRGIISNCRESISKKEAEVKEKEETQRKKAEEEKRARIEAYWAEHPEEKATLDAEKNQLVQQKEGLLSKISEQDRVIDAAKDEEKAKVPSEAESDKIRDQIHDLERRRANLGLFSGKEKKQITEEIASLHGRIDSLKGKIDSEKSARAASLKQRLAPAQEKKDELNAELSKVLKRLSAIEAELEKDPQA